MTKGDIFVFANNFVVLFFSSLEEESDGCKEGN